MSGGLIEVLILTAIALVVLSRLYMALGKDDDPRPPGKAPVRGDTGAPARPEEVKIHNNFEPVFTGPAAAGLEEIYKADTTFRPDEFLRGAKTAYTMIVNAFAAGDREKLRPLLDDDVYEAWDAAIKARETKGADPYRLLRLKQAEIDNAEMDGNIARVMMRYEAELGDGDRVRKAREIWTFMRDVTSPDPNWILDDVEAAS